MHEIGQGAAIIEAHAWPVCVEDTHDAGVHSVRPVISHRHGFGKTLRFVVNAPGPDGVDVAPVFFMLGRNFRITVTFAGRSKKKLCSFGERQSERVVRAERSYLKRLNGKLE